MQGYTYVSVALALMMSVVIFKHFSFNIKKSLQIAIFLGLMGFLLAGIIISHTKIKYYENAVTFFNQEKVTFQGEIINKEFKNEKLRLYLSTDYGGVICFTSNENDYEIGSLLVVSGKAMELMESENEGGFDYKGYLKSRGIYAGFYDPDIKWMEGAINPLPEFFYRQRCKMSEFFSKNLPGEEGGLLSAMVIGDKSDMDEEAADLFQRAGLSHILAISGLHMSVVGMGVLKLLRRLGLSFKVSGFVAGVLVILYGMLSGNPISMIRAVGMFICLVVADITGRGYDMLNALSLMALVLLMDNPFLIDNAGFILSFGAILGIILAASPLQEAYVRLCRRRWEESDYNNGQEHFKLRWHEKIVSSLVSGMGIQLFTYPLILNSFYSIPILSIFLNLIVLPAMGVLLFSGLLAGLLMFGIPLIICHFLLYYYEACADLVSGLPFSTLILGKPYMPVVLIYYGLLLAFIFCLYLFDKNLCIDGVIYRPGALLKKINKRIKIFLLSLLLCAFGLLCLISIKPKMCFHIDMLSVGQGDGIYVQSEDGLRLFIDGGSSSKDNPGKNIILPYLKSQGVSGIDYWIITHLDADHYNGFMEVLESGYRIGNLIVSKAMEKDEVYREIAGLCDAFETKILEVKKGDRLKSGAFEVVFLYPDYPSKMEGTNENSLSFMISSGDFQGIFTGDLGKEGEVEILNDDLFNELIAGEKIELLKAGHHGSKNSNSKEWLEAIDPEIFIISAGKNNRYGHPSPDTIKRLEEAGISHYCTIDCGRIRVEYCDRGTGILSYL